MKWSASETSGRLAGLGVLDRGALHVLEAVSAGGDGDGGGPGGRGLAAGVVPPRALVAVVAVTAAVGGVAVGVAVGGLPCEVLEGVLEVDLVLVDVVVGGVLAGGGRGEEQRVAVADGEWREEVVVVLAGWGGRAGGARL